MHIKRYYRKEKRSKYPLNDLIKMTEFVLTNNNFDFLDKVFRKLFRTALGTKFLLTYVCIYIEKGESRFSKAQLYKRLRYTHLVTRGEIIRFL